MSEGNANTAKAGQSQPRPSGTDELDALEALWNEMRREIETLARVTPDHQKPATPLKYPDPARLDPIERRVLVKSVFSFIEDLAFSMKAWALSSASASDRLTAGEKAVAADESYELSETGRVVSRRARLQTLGNIRFAFYALAKAKGADFVLDVSTTGWEHLRATLKVRDRLTHPKRPADLDVTDDEVRTALRAFVWFESQLVLLMIAIIRALQLQSEQMKSFIARATRTENIEQQDDDLTQQENK